MPTIRRKSRSRKPQTPKLPRFDRNFYIKAPEMRVIDESGENLGILKKEEALKIAQEREQDLILINPQAKPPIAKIITWSKFKYDLSKKKKAQKGKTSTTKGMWIKPLIEEHDLAHKLRRVQEFLGHGDKVKLEIRPKGRFNDRDKIQQLANSITERISEFGELESEPKKEGRNLALYIKPKK